MTATYTFDIFSTLDGYGSHHGDWGGYWGKQGPELLDHRLAVYGPEQRMVFGANTYRQFAQMLGSATEESGVGDPWVSRMRSLVFGPFLIMALFGSGYDGFRRPLETVVVVPPGSTIPTDAASYQKLAGNGPAYRGRRPGRGDRRAGPDRRHDRRRRHHPGRPAGSFKAGKQSVIEVVVDTIDPIRASYA